MYLEKYSIGIGDRFGRQGNAQLSAIIKAKELGTTVIPVWNKSKREHNLIHSSPADVRIEADNAVASIGWKDSYFVDADHIGLKTVDDFLTPCNFFTLDVSDFIGIKPDESDLKEFMKNASDFLGELKIPGVSSSISVTEKMLLNTAERFLTPIKEAGKIYRYINENKNNGKFITEVSLDENHQAQTPVEMFFILLGLANEKISLQTIAPKFTGRFNKGVDYDGNPNDFIVEFESHVAVVDYAVKTFGLPKNLKISIHTGSDKFSLYPLIHNVIKKHDIGVHLKTAGTTWLEELIGLAEAGFSGLTIDKSIYQQSLHRIDELMTPYLTVVDIDVNQLPPAEEVNSWSGEKFANTLRHNQKCEDYNPSFRQLLHLGFRIASEMGSSYLDALEKYKEVIGKNVTENIYDRHIKPLFLGK
jgi:hypothetical protein